MCLTCPSLQAIFQFPIIFILLYIFLTLLHRMWDLSSPRGMNPGPPKWRDRVLTTGLSGKSPDNFYTSMKMQSQGCLYGCTLSQHSQSCLNTSLFYFTKFRNSFICSPGFDSWVGKIPWRRKWQSTPGLLPGKSHGQRNLVGYSPWGHKESDTTEPLHFTSLIRSLNSPSDSTWKLKVLRPMWMKKLLCLCYSLASCVNWELHNWHSIW